VSERWAIYSTIKGMPVRWTRVVTHPNRRSAMEAYQAISSVPHDKYEYRVMPDAGWLLQAEEKMPLVNPHASYIQQDRQTTNQQHWLRRHGFSDARQAYNAGC